MCRRGYTALLVGLFVASVGSVFAEETSSDPTSEIRRLLKEGAARGIRGEQESVQKLLQFGPLAIPILVDSLESPSFRVRRLAARALRESPDRAAIPALAKALDDSDPAVALFCREALVALGVPALRYLRIRDKTVLSSDQRLAMRKVEEEYHLDWVLERLQSMPTEDGTIGLYRGQFEEIREKGEPAIEALLVLVGTREHFPRAIRYLAAGALAEIAEPSTQGAIRDAYRREERPVQNVLAVALARVGDDRILERRMQWYRWQIEVHPARRDRWHYELGYLLFLSGSLRAAIEHFEFCLELQPGGHATASYNLSNIHARLGHIDLAFEWLEKSIEYGFHDLEWLERDTDLDSIRDDPRYLRLTTRLQRLRGEWRGGIGH